jgi:hypothetical protein
VGIETRAGREQQQAAKLVLNNNNKKKTLKVRGSSKVCATFVFASSKTSLLRRRRRRRQAKAKASLLSPPCSSSSSSLLLLLLAHTRALFSLSLSLSLFSDARSFTDEEDRKKNQTSRDKQSSVMAPAQKDTLRKLQAEAYLSVLRAVAASELDWVRMKAVGKREKESVRGAKRKKS